MIAKRVVFDRFLEVTLTAKHDYEALQKRADWAARHNFLQNRRRDTLTDPRVPDPLTPRVALLNTHFTSAPSAPEVSARGKSGRVKKRRPRTSPVRVPRKDDGQDTVDSSTLISTLTSPFDTKILQASQGRKGIQQGNRARDDDSVGADLLTHLLNQSTMSTVSSVSTHPSVNPKLSPAVRRRPLPGETSLSTTKPPKKPSRFKLDTNLKVHLARTLKLVESGALNRSKRHRFHGEHQRPIDPRLSLTYMQDRASTASLSTGNASLSRPAKTSAQRGTYFGLYPRPTTSSPLSDAPDHTDVLPITSNYEPPAAAQARATVA